MDEEKNNLPVKLEGLAVPQKYSDEDFSLATKSGDYLPRLQLMTSMSEKVKEGSFPVNHYALIKDQLAVDLGEEIDVAIIAFRPKALDTGEVVITSYDPRCSEFERIQEKSDEKDSGCMYGPEFLVYVPVAQGFATFFMGSKSARRTAPQVKALMQQAATLKSRKIVTKKYTWWSPAVTKCSTPFDLPDIDELKANVEKFDNPPATVIEKIKDDDDEGEDRAR